MNKTIWKFPLNIDDFVTISMPKEAEILTVQTQNGSPYIWALVNPENEYQDRYFEVFGTGHDIPEEMGIKKLYINTFQLADGKLIFHLFERTASL